MEPIPDSTWQWLDDAGWCDCAVKQDQCPICREARRVMRQAQQLQQARAPQKVRPYAGEPTTTQRKLDW